MLCEWLKYKFNSEKNIDWSDFTDMQRICSTAVTVYEIFNFQSIEKYSNRLAESLNQRHSCELVTSGYQINKKRKMEQYVLEV